VQFHERQHPRDLGAEGVERFLTYLAVRRKVSASTQNQAQQEQRKLWDDYTKEAETKLKALGVQFAPADKAAFFKATQPIRDKYGSKYATLIKKIQDTK
jgi:TRAP-type C4-dicarboxylate transport system substrate-binding protein